MGQIQSCQDDIVISRLFNRNTSAGEFDERVVYEGAILGLQGVM